MGLSGGVDSSVAAYLLKQQGYELEAMFMQNWHDTTGTLHGDCPWKDDLTVAKLVAQQLQIPFHFIDLSATYKQKVVDYMFAEYAKGRTPNPDVLCNREIKFDAFLKAAQELGAEYVATGHYCQKETLHTADGDVHCLIAGADPNKDQSYFLCQLSQSQLAKALFPIGGMLKPEVRAIATELNLPTADKKDSQGICFVGKVDLPVFLQQQLKAKKGAIIELPKDTPTISQEVQADNLTQLAKPHTLSANNGKIVGEHNGAHFFTIGQRKGLGIGGHIEPLFVVGTDVEQNIVYVGEGNQHPCLLRKALLVNANETHWIRPQLKMEIGEERDFMVRIRYRQPLQKARLYARTEGLYIVFEALQQGIAAGQFAAWYDNTELIGSGVISA
ncbi:MAG: tRNA 2-thiouridine(34) synthase MnmA [Bacteroidales bacterium]